VTAAFALQLAKVVPEDALTVKLTLTGNAASKFPSPVCVAVRVVVPAPTMFSVFPLVIVATLVSELVSATVNPDEEVAINVFAASPTVAVAGSNPKVIT
jgi:hypothetical protein